MGVLDDDSEGKLRTEIDALGVVDRDGKRCLMKKMEEVMLAEINMKDGGKEKSNFS